MPSNTRASTNYESVSSQRDISKVITTFRCVSALLGGEAIRPGVVVSKGGRIFVSRVGDTFWNILYGLHMHIDRD